MLEECVDNLELATKALNRKIVLLEEEENALLFNNTTTNTDSNSIDATVLTNKDTNPYQATGRSTYTSSGAAAYTINHR